MKSLCVIIVYFGPWPEWTPLFLKTCAWNSTVNWLIVSDQAAPAHRCRNVRFLRLSLQSFEELAGERLGFSFRIVDPYKLCDLKPAYGRIFEKEIAGYDYFGWGDLDVFYGDLRRFLDPHALSCEALSFHGKRWLSNHFLLMKNTRRNRLAYRQIKGFRSLIRDPRYCCVDDVLFTPVVFSKRPYLVEAFSTPGTPLIPWRDGTSVFPTQWYWRRGKLTNNRDKGIEFMYLHFMSWKGSRYFRDGPWKKLPRIVSRSLRSGAEGWKVNARGIFPLDHGR